MTAYNHFVSIGEATVPDCFAASQAAGMFGKLSSISIKLSDYRIPFRHKWVNIYTFFFYIVTSVNFSKNIK